MDIRKRSPLTSYLVPNTEQFAVHKQVVLIVPISCFFVLSKVPSSVSGTWQVYRSVSSKQC